MKAKLSLDLLPLDVAEQTNLRHLAYVRLRDAIAEGKLMAGCRIDERSLAASLKISTTPVKDALRRLEAEGLIVTLPRKGTYVTSFTLTDILEQVQIRSALEGAAAYLAAQNFVDGRQTVLTSTLHKMKEQTQHHEIATLKTLNRAFHEEIYKLAGSERLTRLLNTFLLIDYTVRGRILETTAQPEIAYQEHETIFNLIVSKQPSGAEEAMRNHVKRSGSILVDRLS